MSLKRRLCSLLLVSVFLINLLPACTAFASGNAAVYFADNFDSYSAYGGEVPPKHWDVILQDDATGSDVKIEQNDGNGFAAFDLKTGLTGNQVTSALVTMKKNNLNNAGRSVVYESSFYAFDKYAKTSISFTDSRGADDVELVSLKGNELSVRGANNVMALASDIATMKEWNKISFVFDGVKSVMKVYLNGAQAAGETPVDLKGLDLTRLSLKVAAKNNTADPYIEGRIHMDNVYVYEGVQPIGDTAQLAVPGMVTTYLNKQFTSIATNFRAHGVVSFESTVRIIDSPDALNKSAEITLGKDGAYIPFEAAADKDFESKVIYKADSDVGLYIKDDRGKPEKLLDLAQSTDFETAKITFDFRKSKAVIAYLDGKTEDAEFSLKNVKYFGFFGDGTKLTLNKLFAYGGATDLDDSYFKDYSYQNKAIMALTTTGWKSAYATVSKGVFFSVDYYEASAFGSRFRIKGQPPRVFGGNTSYTGAGDTTTASADNTDEGDENDITSTSSSSEATVETSDVSTARKVQNSAGQSNIPYMPINETAVILGGEVIKDNDDGVTISANGSEVEVAAADIHTEKATKYITAQKMADIFGLTLSWDGSYLIGFGKGQLFSSREVNEDLKSAIYYERPTGDEIVDRIEKMGNINPRILANAERIAEVKANINSNPMIKEWYNKLKGEADKNLNAYTLYFTKPDGVRLLSVSNLMVDRMETLGIVYKMTGDTKYAEAAWRDLNAVSKFFTWNPTHFLDIGTMSTGIAVGYSWFYDYLTDEQKDIIVEGYKRNCLAAYIDAVDSRDWWTPSTSNWNPWCHGGVMLGLIALSDRLGDEGKYALDRMFPYLEYLYPGFVPDGAWLEGTAYHAATLMRLAMWNETITIATGKDFGYWDLPGMDKTSYYGDALSGAGGVFNYGDNTETRANYDSQAWFAKKYNDPGLAQLRFASIQTNNFKPTINDLLWTRPEMFGEKNTMDSDVVYNSLNVLSMRTSWTDSTDGIFLAAKGGENGLSHFHYDLGGFVMDIGGVRFAYELGREGYEITAGDSKTYQYKKRAEGHNTYVINPTDLPGQGDNAIAKVIDFKTGKRGGYGVIDLTQAYSEARNIKRGFFLTNDRQTIIIQDEVDLTGESDVYWFMHTKGDVKLSDDAKTAFVTLSGVTARFDILDSDNGGAAFEVVDPLPLPTTPWLEGQGKNESYRKLRIHWNGVQKYNLAIAASQVIDPQIPYEKPAFVPISDWKIQEGELAAKPVLTSINKDGTRLESFSPDKYSYTVNLPYNTTENPVYSFTANENMEVTRIDSGGMTGVTKFIVRDKNTDKYSIYAINTKIVGYIGPIPGAKEASVVKVTASEEPEYDAGNRAVCVLDGNYTSRWTATDDAWINLELKEAVPVFALGIAWHSGDSRTYLYDIEVSEDGDNWTKVVDGGSSSGATTELECFLLGNVKSKYVRYLGHGHTAGNWNNVTEMRVYTK